MKEQSKGTAKARKGTTKPQKGTKAMTGTAKAKKKTAKPKQKTKAAKATTKKVGKRTTLDETKLKKIIDERLIFAISHVVRAHVLAVLNEQIASPSEVGKGIGVDVTYISYHFEKLEEIGFIELVRVEPRRGVDEHFYRAKKTFLIDDRECALLPASVKSAMSADLFQSILDDVVRALMAGTFAAGNDPHVSWTTKHVDEKGFSDLDALLVETLQKVFA